MAFHPLQIIITVTYKTMGIILNIIHSCLTCLEAVRENVGEGEPKTKQREVKKKKISRGVNNFEYFAQKFGRCAL